MVGEAGAERAHVSAAALGDRGLGPWRRRDQRRRTVEAGGGDQPFGVESLEVGHLPCDRLAPQLPREHRADGAEEPRRVLVPGDRPADGLVGLGIEEEHHAVGSAVGGARTCGPQRAVDRDVVEDGAVDDAVRSAGLLAVGGERESHAPFLRVLGLAGRAAEGVDVSGLEPPGKR